MRKILAVVGTAVALSASTLVVAPGAQAAEVDLRSLAWSAEKDGRIHVLYEHWERNSLPSDVTVRIRAKGSDTVLATLGLNDAESCPTAYDCLEQQFWTDPVELPTMGVYAIDLVVKAGTAGELVDRDNGELNYGLAPKLTATADRQTVSYDHRVVTVSGTLVARDPNNGEVKPFTGAKIYSRYMLRDQPLKTVDKAGRFSLPFEFSGYETAERISLWFQENNASFPVTVHRQPLKLTVNTPTGTVTAPYGSDVPVRGKVTRTADDGTEKPAGGVGVLVGDRPVTSTKEDGTFAGAFTATKNGTTRVGPGQEPWFTGGAPYDFQLRTAATSTFPTVEAAVDKYRKVTFSGTLGVTSGSYPAGTTGQVSIDHSPDGKNWSSVGRFTATYGATFQQTAPTKGVAGSYWRLRHLAAPGVESRVYNLGRAYTEIRQDSVAPEGIRKGTRLTAKGTLMQKSGTTWKAYAGRQVRVYFKAATPGAAWQELGSAKTLTNGTFSKQFTVRQNGTWQMRHIDTVKTHYASSGREIPVTIR
ncbi:hypothetical protein ACIQ7D_23135 [Streptomyces sp. NPDC096310]|uniref:hypothetical protein n=1 Tax=Streptomyces sp. NPDC096310 TaxID=3366082 RepID=UPI003805503B